MKKNIIGSIIVAITLAFALWGCNPNKPALDQAAMAQQGNRKPIISIADLMIDKITSTHDTTKSIANTIIKLRGFDNLLYRALLDSPNTISTKYFYSRRGSCCPCTPGGQSCCKCSSGSAFGVATQGISEARGIDSRGSVFMLAKMSAPISVDSTLQLSSTTMDAMKIFTLPANTSAGTFKVSFKGNSIDLTLVIEVDADGNIEISDLQ